MFLQSWSQFHKSGSDNPFQRYIHSKFWKMVRGRHLGFGSTGSRSIRSADSIKPYRGTKHEVDPTTRSPVAKISPIFPCACALSISILAYILLIAYCSIQPLAAILNKPIIISAILLLPAEVLVADSDFRIAHPQFLFIFNSEWLWLYPA